MSELDSGELYLGVDCGGTNLRAAAAGRDGRIVAELVVPTGDAAEREDGLGRAIRAVVRSLVLSLGPERRIAGVGVGLPFVCHEGRAYLCRNVKALDPGRLEADLRADHGAPAALLNDVKCAALGEEWLGAARGASSFVFLNVGTGLSSAFYSGGRLLMGAHHAAGEIGYWVADAADPVGFAEGLGPLEESMSGVGISGAYRRAVAEAAAAAGAPAPVGATGAPGAMGETIRAEEVFARAAAGDPVAARVVERGVAHLLPAVANLATLLDPELLVLGGGVSKGLAAHLGRLVSYVGRMTPFPPRIVLSALEGRAGLVGAVRLGMLAAEGREP
ncbi:MAG: ROK family protein [Spirochaetaceae bacterium]|nr:ROK family protein [Spirochaetaceae bacterium]